ncbi:MAG: site-specific DNA-methyltransferase [Ruminococcaceae bacterium]|nr:site-specific DNA-methyltransferase [Oscillospiraceae bacterium]
MSLTCQSKLKNTTEDLSMKEVSTDTNSLAHTTLRPLFEPILWFMKPYEIGTTLTDNIKEHNVGAYNEQYIKDNHLSNTGIEVCSNIIKCNAERTDRGLHPTQKPVALMEYLIGISTIEGQTVLDPFCGCGTTLVAAKNLGRNYIGIEKEREYYDIITQRLL